MAHPHHHHHDVGHDHGGHGTGRQNSISQENEKAFDNHAASFAKIPWVVKLGEQMTKELRDNVDWIRATDSVGKKGRLLDYACGGGVATRALAPFFEFSCGIDISSGMLKEFDRLAEEEGYTKDQMKAVRGDLLDPEGTPAPELAGPEYFNFDTTTMTTALHHVGDVDTMLRRLVERTRPGGSVLIVDMVGKNREDMPEGMGVVHGGFTEEQMRSHFEKAGLEKFGWKLFQDLVDMPADIGGPKILFLARGVKPVSS